MAYAAASPVDWANYFAATFSRHSIRFALLKNSFGLSKNFVKTPPS